MNKPTAHIDDATIPLPAGLLAEVAADLAANPERYRHDALMRAYDAVRPGLWAALQADGMDRERAASVSNGQAWRLIQSTVPARDRFAAADPELVEPEARHRFTRELNWVRQIGSRDAVACLRAWGTPKDVLDAVRRDRKAVIAAERGRREIAARPETMAAAQRAIIRDTMPEWEHPRGRYIAPGVRGLVEVVARTGTVHVWTMVADEPCQGAGGRFLDSLPRDRIVRVFDVTPGSLYAAMLRRRGFERSRYTWEGRCYGEPGMASAGTWYYRQPR